MTRKHRQSHRHADPRWRQQHTAVAARVTSNRDGFRNREVKLLLTAISFYFTLLYLHTYYLWGKARCSVCHLWPSAIFASVWPTNRQTHRQTDYATYDICSNRPHRMHCVHMMQLKKWWDHDTDQNRRQASLVGEASAVTNATTLSSDVAVHSSHRPGPAEENALLVQSSRHLQAGTTGPLADPTPANCLTYYSSYMYACIQSKYNTENNSRKKRDKNDHFQN